MLFLVDTIQVDPARAGDYLALVASVGAPIMADAGAPLVSCWSTAADLGEDVDVLLVWSVGDHERWNVTRKNLVLDPRWHRYAREASRMRKGGTRRFYRRAPFPAGA